MINAQPSQILTNAPVLRTARLVLRGPQPEDFEPIAAFYAEPERSAGFGGPIPRDEAWRWFASSIGHWHLHGFGFWTVTLDDAPIGIVGHWAPEGWDEPELGWVLFAGSEGQGFAAEAALAVRDYTYNVMGWSTLISQIVPGNTRSIALAERLGCVLEREIDNVNMGQVLVYRHPAREGAT